MIGRFIPRFILNRGMRNLYETVYLIMLRSFSQFWPVVFFNIKM